MACASPGLLLAVRAKQSDLAVLQANTLHLSFPEQPPGDQRHQGDLEVQEPVQISPALLLGAETLASMQTWKICQDLSRNRDHGGL